MDRRVPVREEHQGKQDPAHAPVAIHEWMDGLKMSVNDRSAGQHTEPEMTLGIGFIADEPVQPSHESWYFPGRRWNEAGVLHLQPTDVLLDIAKFPRDRARFSAHEMAMQ